MKKKNEAILMLEYSLGRYKEMGDGVKCQSLISQLDKLRAGATAKAN